MYIYTCMHACSQIYTKRNIYTYVYTYTYIYIVYKNISIYIYVRIHVHMYIYIYWGWFWKHMLFLAGGFETMLVDCIAFLCTKRRTHVESKLHYKVLHERDSDAHWFSSGFSWFAQMAKLWFVDDFHKREIHQFENVYAVRKWAPKFRARALLRFRHVSIKMQLEGKKPNKWASIPESLPRVSSIETEEHVGALAQADRGAYTNTYGSIS